MSPRLEHSPQFDDVRAAHRSEPAPAQLRRRSLARFEGDASGAQQPAAWQGHWRLAWALYRRSATALLAASVGALLLWLFAQTIGAGGLASGEGTPAPESLSEEKLGAERVARRARTTSHPGSGDPMRPCPRQSSDQERPDPMSAMNRSLEGMTEHFLRVPARDCPPLMRRYLERLPDALPARAPVPVMILLHDTGQTAERARLETRWYFEALALEKGFVLIYASAASVEPTEVPPVPMRDTWQKPFSAVGGRWQTDPEVDPEIDDELYLERIVGDLESRGVIAGRNAVWLVGFGGGATLALTVASEYPDLYSGVAAFEPSRVEIAPPTELRGSRLERVLLAGKGKPDEVWGATALQGLAQRWALALGVRGRGPARYSLQGKLGRFDLSNESSQGPSVRVLAFDPGLDAFAPPGAVEPTALAELRRQPGFVSGAEQAWQYLKNGPAPR